MKKRLAIAGIIATVMALCAMGTLAYFTAEGRATNVITTGTVAMNLHEMQRDANDTETEYPNEPITNVMPNQTVSKIPYVENIGSEDFYTRVKVVVTATGANRESLEDDAVSLNVNPENWVKDGDWYYYTQPVAPGVENRVAPFDTVTFLDIMDNTYQGCTVSIDVQAQAVQVKNNEIPATGTILDVQGWPMA